MTETQRDRTVRLLMDVLRRGETATYDQVCDLVESLMAATRAPLSACNVCGARGGALGTICPDCGKGTYVAATR